MSENQFEQLEQIASEVGVEAALGYMETRFRDAKEYFKLFEVLKMQCRHQIGLPLIYTQEPDAIDETGQRELEDGLLDACRDVGTLLFEDGKLHEGWMYLQPVGDRELSERLIREVEPNEENLDVLVEIAVSQGAAPAYGLALVLEHYGTCNGITSFDTQTVHMPKAVQREMAQTLLGHIYRELTSNVRHTLEKNDCAVDGSEGLTDLMALFPDLRCDGAYHIDTTHLASALRIGRVVDDRASLKMALELAEYGIGLAAEYQHPGDPPFEETHRDHLFFYSALLGNNVEEAITHFERKLVDADGGSFAGVVCETLVDLLVRLGENDRAVNVLVERMLDREHETLGIAAGPFEIANTPELARRLSEFYRGEKDLLGFGVGVMLGRGE